MEAAPLRVFFYVQHLLGIGHIQRASLLVKACVAAGMTVTVASGGESVTGFDFGTATLVQLPPVRSADAGFSGLVDQAGNSLSESFKLDRCHQLLSAFNDSNADIVVIENYPFGRRQLRWELKPLLKAANERVERPLVTTSIRDILQCRSTERETETTDLIAEYFDAVLVHGDAGFLPLSQSFGQLNRISEKLVYTGYVINNGAMPLVISDAGKDEVIVSAGGGAVGFGLMKTALDARGTGYLSELTWRFLLGPNVSEQDRKQLQQNTSENCVFESVRQDFPVLLKNCKLSVSQAGYNTVMDILQAGCPALLIPFERGGETEQRLRTDRLEAMNRCASLSENALDSQSFIQNAERALKMDFSSAVNINRQGAENTASILPSLWQQKNNRA